MRSFFLFCLSLASFSAFSQPQIAGMKEMIITGGLSSGKTYQVAEHCGATAEALKSYKAHFEADTKGGEQLYASLQINIEEVFRQGRKDGDTFYASIKSAPNRDAICSQTLSLLKSQAAR